LTDVSLLKKWADVHKIDSVSNKLRSKRFRLFEELCSSLPKPLTIIDIGGTVDFWAQRRWADNNDVHITLVNLHQEPQRYANITPVVGDASNLHEFARRSFDVAFSNSVIEHLFTFENQAAMAREIQRVATAYWIQTPNYWFPIEPHFHVPGWQWMPIWLRVEIIRRYTCGWRGRTPDPKQALIVVSEVNLMTKSQLRRIFPTADIIPERFFGLNKSWIVYGGFPAEAANSIA
jgi:Methyltransferase domain